ncbi:MAG: phosphoribosylformylglycinamidine synthase subunit PurL [Planctomycetes bacterium]|nr:phosphoribosylformylglycinamidine synthase subunit PurL [Planctomycetota bacterium]
MRPGLPDPEGEGAQFELRELGADVRTARAYRGYFIDGALTRAQAERAANLLLADPISESARIRNTNDKPFVIDPDARRIDIIRKPGVMDPVAASVSLALEALNIQSAHVATFRCFEIVTSCGAEALRAAATKTLANETIELLTIDRSNPPLPFDPAARAFKRLTISIRALEGAALDKLSADMCLSLTRLEMEAVRDHYRSLDREPSDAELETIAQTWSEHCKHKTLRGPCDYIENGAAPRRIDSILGETIVKATETVRKDWCLSVFVDNAGVIAFDERHAVCFKVETHNHPSAIEPYGGAGTGIGGVIRDVVGTGVGARPIASTDIFCVGPADLTEEKLPRGTLHPSRVLRGVISGVRDYGNRMGIPTINGGVFVDNGYISNPLVFCGTVGLMPREAVRKEVKPGDLIIMIGGRTGRDGIHGATFSSVELHEESQTVSATAVQIGDPITEKKATEAILRARDEKLLRSLTDCGAGGLSSAIGELAEDTGAEVFLERVPLKYAGLRYDEIWISEAQERMVAAVAPEHAERLLQICREEQAEATILGTFTNTKRLLLKYQNEVVGDLDLHFLHKGVPRVVRQAVYNSPAESDPAPPRDSELGSLLLQILSSPNVASKEWIVRRYDHEVQGTSVIKPFVGVRRDGPSDGAVIAPVYGSPRGVALGNGLNPRYGQLDPAALAESSIDEAMRNIVAIGGDPDRTAILDNYCWGNCNKPDRLGGLVRASEAARDLAIAYETPFISGKDSLNNEYRVGGESIPIPPTFLVSAISIVEDVSRCMTMDFKEAGNAIVIVGPTRDELGGSHLHLVRNVGFGKSAPRVDASLGRAALRGVARALREGLARACHDLSEGGLAVAVAEMAFAGDIGAVLDLHNIPLAMGTDARVDLKLFSESNSRFLLEVPKANLEKLRAALIGVPHAAIGETTGGRELKISDGRKEIFNIPIDELRKYYKSGFPAMTARVPGGVL